MVDNGAPLPEQPESQKAWAQATVEKVEHIKERTQNVHKALQELEQKEAERVAAQLAERQRQEALAAAAEERRKREALQRAEEERRRQQAELMRLRREEMEAAKRDASAAVKAATANFHRQTHLEAEGKEKASRMQAMNDAVQKVGNAVSKCQHECRMKFSAVKVCEMRLALRENKPQEELFRDDVHEALEKELQVLTAAREELQTWAKSGEQVKVEIEETQMLLLTGNSRENVARRLQRGSSLPSLVGPPNAPTTEELIKTSYELVEKALRISQSSYEALQRAITECDQATARVTASFDRRTAQTEELKKSLEFQKKHATATIHTAERRLAMLKMRAHKTPETPRSSEATQEQMQAVEDLLADLKSGKKHLEQDYRNKTSSYKVDKSCRGLTKVKAGTHVSRMNLAPLQYTQSSPTLSTTF